MADSTGDRRDPIKPGMGHYWGVPLGPGVNGANRMRCCGDWLLVLLFGGSEIGRRIVGLVAELLHFFGEGGAVVALRVGGEKIGLALVVPVVGCEALSFLEVRDGGIAMACVIEVLGQGELGVGLEAFRRLGREALAQLIRAQDKFTLRAFGDPIAHCVEIRRGFEVGEGFEAIVRKSHFGRPNDFALLVDPDTGGHVDEPVEPRDDLLLINQHSEIGIRFGDPRAGIANSAGILRDGQDFEIFAAQFLVEGLPPGQVKAAPSPGGPSEQQDFLAAKVGERVHLAIHVRQGEIGSFERIREMILCFGAGAEIPSA